MARKYRRIYIANEGRLLTATESDHDRGGPDDDVAFFKQNPGRRYRVRLATRYEIAKAPLGELPLDEFWCALVHGAEQALAFRHRAAVGDTPKLGIEIDDVGRKRPVQTKVTSKLGIADETDVQRAIISTVRREIAELIAPETTGLPGRHLVPSQTNDIGSLAWLGNEFEVGKDDFLIIT
jgi:hypothetical protein